MIDSASYTNRTYRHIMQTRQVTTEEAIAEYKTRLANAEREIGYWYSQAFEARDMIRKLEK